MTTKETLLALSGNAIANPIACEFLSRIVSCDRRCHQRCIRVAEGTLGSLYQSEILSRALMLWNHCAKGSREIFFLEFDA